MLDDARSGLRVVRIGNLALRKGFSPAKMVNFRAMCAQLLINLFINDFRELAFHMLRDGKLLGLIGEESGATAVEYALAMLLIACGFTAVRTIGANTTTTYSNVSNSTGGADVRKMTLPGEQF